MRSKKKESGFSLKKKKGGEGGNNESIKIKI